MREEEEEEERNGSELGGKTKIMVMQGKDGDDEGRPRSNKHRRREVESKHEMDRHADK